MKRFLAVLLSCLLVMSFALTGCSNKTEDKAEPTNTTTQSQTPNKVSDAPASTTPDNAATAAAETPSVSTTTTPTASTTGENNNAGKDSNVTNDKNAGKDNNSSKAEDTNKDSNTSDKSTSKRNENKQLKNDPHIKMIRITVNDASLVDKIQKYKELHPDYPYDINVTATGQDSDYLDSLSRGLAAKDHSGPDIYIVNSSQVEECTKGKLARYAASYKELAIDVDKLAKKAEIAPYMLDMGKGKDGDILGVGIESAPGAFIYRRSIAKAVWGTDNPETIQAAIGGSWDNFMKAAKKLKAKGYAIVAGQQDIWSAYNCSVEDSWLVNGKLSIASERKAFLDIAKTLKDKKYHNNSLIMDRSWIGAMNGESSKKVFGFFGTSGFIGGMLNAFCGKTAGDWAICEPPKAYFDGGTWAFVNRNSQIPGAAAELVQWMTLDTSKTGLQYLMASGAFENDDHIKSTVASNTVMKRANGKLKVLDNQNMFDVFTVVNKSVKAKSIEPQFDTISTFWSEQVSAYAKGKKTQAKAIEDMKKEIKRAYGISANAR